ncbi:MAG: hypothetical protein HYY85_17750 [Deltaproteobacteria bacterium]|nr:hypothetical protein [Deltaproteobacteria bacterium]
MVAYVKGIRDYLKAPQGEEVVRVVSKYTQVSPEIVAKSQKMCIDPTGRVPVENIMEQQEFWYARGEVERRLTAEDLITQAFAEAAERRLR